MKLAQIMFTVMLLSLLTFTANAEQITPATSITLAKETPVKETILCPKFPSCENTNNEEKPPVKTA